MQDAVMPSLALALAHAGELEALQALMELVSPAVPAPPQRGLGVLTHRGWMPFLSSIALHGVCPASMHPDPLPTLS